MTTGLPGTKGNPFIKDPESTLDYIWNWTDWLVPDGDTINTSPAPVITPLVAADASILVVVGAAEVIDDARRVRAFLSGGVVGQTYKVNCLITTVLAPTARVDPRTIHIKCREK